MIIFTLETVVAHLMSVGYDWIHWSCSFFPKKTSFKCHSFETILIRFFHAVSELMDSFMKFQHVVGLTFFTFSEVGFSTVWNFGTFSTLLDGIHLVTFFADQTLTIIYLNFAVGDVWSASAVIRPKHIIFAQKTNTGAMVFVNTILHLSLTNSFVCECESAFTFHALILKRVEISTISQTCKRVSYTSASSTVSVFAFQTSSDSYFVLSGELIVSL